MKTRRICVVDTPYTLFLYFLICGYDENDIIVVSAGIPESIRKNFNHIYFPKFTYYPLNMANIKLKKVSYSRIYQILKLRSKLFFKTLNCAVEVYGHGHLGFSFPLYEHDESYILEDGVGNYINNDVPSSYDDSFSQKALHFLGNTYTNYYESFGTHRNIKRVYLTKNDVPKVLEDKAVVIDFKKSWNAKSESEKRKILEIFNIDKVIEELDDNLTLLITQCLNEDNLMPLDEEIEIYDYLIKNHGNDDIVIKTHPREVKDYNKIFPEIKVIREQFPLEILKCVDININEIITVSSTAALNFVGECRITQYDKETSSERVNRSIEILKDEIEMNETAKKEVIYFP